MIFIVPYLSAPHATVLAPDLAVTTPQIWDYHSLGKDLQQPV